MSAAGAMFFLPGIIVNRYVYMSALFFIGFSVGINNVKFISLFQETVPAAVKGRFFAVMQAVISFTFPAAYFIFGMIADYLTPPAMCLMQGAGTAGVALFFFSMKDSARKIEYDPG